MNVTFAISSPAIEPSGRTDCTIERIGSGTNDLTVDGMNGIRAAFKPETGPGLGIGLGAL